MKNKFASSASSRFRYIKWNLTSASRDKEIEQSSDADEIGVKEGACMWTISNSSLIATIFMVQSPFWLIRCLYLYTPERSISFLHSFSSSQLVFYFIGYTDLVANHWKTSSLSLLNVILNVMKLTKAYRLISLFKDISFSAKDFHPVCYIPRPLSSGRICQEFFYQQLVHT